MPPFPGNPVSQTYFAYYNLLKIKKPGPSAINAEMPGSTIPERKNKDYGKKTKN
jgi:hypothetical protein